MENLRSSRHLNQAAVPYTDGFRRTLIILLVIVLMPAVASVILNLLFTNEGNQIAINDVVTTPVSQGQRDLGRPVSMHLLWGQGTPLIMPTASGIVTAIPVTEDTPIKHGDRLLKVDNRWIIGLSSEEPFWRNLDSSSKGADVEMLNKALAMLGLSHGEKAWSSRTSAGVRQYQEKYLEVDTDSVTDTFSIDSIIWLPSYEIHIGNIEAQLSAPTPAPGTAAFSTLPQLHEATPQDLDGQKITLDDKESWVFDIDRGGVSVSISDGEISVEGRATLSQMLDVGTEIVTGRVRLSNPTTLTKLPSTALMSSTEGYCVWSAVSTSEIYQPTKITVIEGDSQGVFVSESVTGEVVLNPNELGDEYRCP